MRYAAAALFTVLALLVRLALNPYLHDNLPYVTFFVAVAASIWFGGLGPALLSAMTSLFAAEWFFIQPRYAITTHAADYVVGHLAYLVITLAIVFFGQGMHKARGKALRREWELERRAAELDGIVSSMADGLCIVDPTGRVVRMNASAERLLGISTERMADTISERLHSLDITKSDGTPFSLAESPSHRALHGETVVSLIQVVHLPDGERWLSVNSAPIYIADGSVLGAVTTFTDITEERKTQNTLQAGIRMLTAANSAGGSVDDTIRVVLDETEALTGSNISFYHFLDADQETLTLQSWSTSTLQIMCTAEGKGSHYPISKAGIWVDCVRERRPVIHNDYASVPHRRGLPEGHAPVIRELVVPVFRDGLIVAIIGVGNKPTDYGEKDVETVCYLGDLSWTIVGRKQAEAALMKAQEHKLDFYRRTIAAATDDKLIITESARIEEIAGPAVSTWELSAPSDVRIVRHAVESAAESAGIEQPKLRHLTIAVGEAVTNAVKHVPRGEVSLHRTEDALMVVVSDRGPGIPALALPDVALRPGYSTAGTLGMGYKMMLRFADKVYLATGTEGTTVGILMWLHASEHTANIAGGSRQH